MQELTKRCKSSLETRPKVFVVPSSKYIVSRRGRMENQCKIRSKKTGGSLSSVLHDKLN